MFNRERLYVVDELKEYIKKNINDINSVKLLKTIKSFIDALTDKKGR